jgi:hypothetical protein
VTASPPPRAEAEHLFLLCEAAWPEDPAGWAIRQGLGPLLADAGVGGGAFDHARARAAIVWQALAVHLERTLAALDGAAVPALVLKGAALATAHYADPAHRPMSDLDVLVPARHWRAAATVLESLGFALDDPAEHGAGFAGPGGVRVELHSALVTCPGVFPVRFEGLHDRSVPLPMPWRGRRLGNEDLLLHAALHAGFQHGFRVRVAHYVDVARLVEAPLDWERLAERAADMRARACLAALFAVAGRFLSIREPAAFRDWRSRHLPARVSAWLAACRRAAELLEGLPLARARWALAEGPVCRALLLTGTLWPARPDGSREVSPWKALARGRRLIQHLR